MLGRKLQGASASGARHYVISNSGANLVKTEVTTRVPVYRGAASAGATLIPCVAVNSPARLAYAISSGQLRKFDVSGNNPVHLANLSVPDIRQVLYSEALDTVYSLARTQTSSSASTVYLRTHDPDTLAVINTSALTGAGTNSYNVVAYLDEASSLVFLAIHVGASAYDTRIYAWQVGSGGSIGSATARTFNGDVGNPPYVGINATKKLIYWSRTSPINRYDIYAYNSTTGLVDSATTSTITATAAPYSIAYSSSDGNYMFAAVPGLTGAPAIYDVSTPSSPTRVSASLQITGRYGEVGYSNQILQIDDLNLLIVTADDGKVSFVDVATMASPSLLGTYTSTSIPVQGRAHLVVE